MGNEDNEAHSATRLCDFGILASARWTCAMSNDATVATPVDANPEYFQYIYEVIEVIEAIM